MGDHGDAGAMGVRLICEADAAAFLTLNKELDKETSFMLLEPGERSTTAREQVDRIRQILVSTNQMIFIAESGDRLVGYMAILGGAYRRNRRCAHIVMGVIQDYAGKGIGTSLMRTGEGWACQRNISRLELTVMTHNKGAVALYKKMGFGIEGTRRRCLEVDGKLVNEYWMAKLICPPRANPPKKLGNAP